jgi:hypothetical protein
MLAWYEDFSGFCLEQILKLELDNRAWSKALRLESSALVKSRLSKEIDRDGYLERRKASQADAVECKRRSEILVQQIIKRQEFAGSQR